MKRKRIFMVELEREQNNLDTGKEFIRNFQTAILLSLLEKGQLNQWQFDCCMDKLKEMNIFNFQCIQIGKSVQASRKISALLTVK